jgi:hypothetical protein
MFQLLPGAAHFQFDLINFVLSTSSHSWTFLLHHIPVFKNHNEHLLDYLVCSLHLLLRSRKKRANPILRIAMCQQTSASYKFFLSSCRRWLRLYLTVRSVLTVPKGDIIIYYLCLDLFKKPLRAGCRTVHQAKQQVQEVPLVPTL